MKKVTKTGWRTSSHPKVEGDAANWERVRSPPKQQEGTFHCLLPLFSMMKVGYMSSVSVVTWSEYFHGYHHILIISLRFFSGWLACWDICAVQNTSITMSKLSFLKILLTILVNFWLFSTKVLTYGTFKPGRIKCDSRKYKRFLFGDNWNDPFIFSCENKSSVSDK